MDGAIVIRASVPAFTDSVAVPLTAPDVAVTVYAPAAVAVQVVVVPVVGAHVAPAVADHVGEKALTALPNASAAVAVNAALPPAVIVEVAVVTVIAATAPGPTVMDGDVPVVDAVVVSVAVTVCAPAVLKVTGNVPTPFVSVAFAGRTAWPSLLVMCTVPV